MVKVNEKCLHILFSFFSPHFTEVYLTCKKLYIFHSYNLMSLGVKLGPFLDHMVIRMLKHFGHTEMLPGSFKRQCVILLLSV